jgi:hypothetical protein
MEKLIVTSVQSFLIWLATNLLAAGCFVVATLAGIHFEPVLCDQCSTTLFYAVIVGLIFSSPVILVLIPCLFIVSTLTSIRKRILFSFVLTAGLSLAVIAVFMSFAGFSSIEQPKVLMFLMPYIVMAEVSMFTIGKKQIFGQEPNDESTTSIIDL